MKKRLPAAKKLLALQDVLREELKDKEFKKYYEEEYTKLETLTGKERGKEKPVTKKFIENLKRGKRLKTATSNTPTKTTHYPSKKTP